MVQGGAAVVYVALFLNAACSVQAARIKRKPIGLTCPSTVNTVFPKEHRLDCPDFHSRHADENERRKACYAVGCCWSPLEHGSHRPWCFSKPLCAKQVIAEERQECTDFEVHHNYKHWDQDVRGRACESVGCCWQPLGEGSNHHWCFKPPSQESTTAIPDNDGIVGKYNPVDDASSNDWGDIATKYSPADEGIVSKYSPDNNYMEGILSKHDLSHEAHIDAEEEVIPELETTTPQPEAATATSEDESLHSSDGADADGDQADVAPENSPNEDTGDGTVQNEEHAEPASVPDSGAEPISRHEAGPSPGTIIVSIDKATNLPDTDHWFADKTDAFVSVKVGGVKEETPAITNDLNPEWNWRHTFKFGRSDALLTLSLWDEDRWLNFWWNGHDHIHDIQVSFRGLSPGKEVVFSEPVLPHGSIQFRVQWQPHQ